MATEQKKMTDCYWFLQNQCIKGKECEYRHSETALNNPTICKFWVEGRCNNEGCIFRHPSGVQTTKDRSQIPCVYFSQGMCTKGDTCLFSHSAPGSNPDFDKKKKEEEEQLRKLQEARKLEEEKLARLKVEEEKLQKQKNNKPVNTQQSRTTPQKKKLASGDIVASVGTFVKSFDDIIKEKAKEKQVTNRKTAEKKVQQKKSGLAGKNKKETQKVEKKEDKGSQVIVQKPKGKQTEEPTGPMNFGVKTLDQIIKEKEGEDVVNPPAQVVPAKSSEFVEELKKKNQNKFNLSPKRIKGDTAKKSQPQPVTQVVKNTSPKRKLKDEPKLEQEIEVKKQRIEQSPKVRKSISTDNLDEFDKELADLGMDVSSTTDGAIDIDAEEFDQEIEDLIKN